MNDIHDILRKYWGFEQFRPLQAEIIRSALNNQDTLALLPTGGGKSLCFQVPALAKEGICIVISPLIALMKDQVYHLQQRGIPAIAIYSGMRPQEIDHIFENACQGAYKLLYISPERLKTDLAQARIQRMNVNLIAIDEAHCISQWGYDFRPPYLQIADLRTILPDVPFLALTATATPAVVVDIQEKLGFNAPNVFQQSFLRSNLSYSVLYEQRKQDKLIDILKKVPGSAVIYTRSRGETKSIAQMLQSKGLQADFYHAGLPAEDRSKRQEAWITGQSRIIVCTNAFGMGIDKPDVRTVVHLMMPESLEAYFQEAGRAGRDGEKAYAVLLFTPADADVLKKHYEMSFPDIETVRRVYQALGSYTQIAIGAGLGESIDFDLAHFAHVYKFQQPHAHAALRLLEQEGWIAVSDALHAPARVHVVSTREVLYDYQIRNKQGDTVIKAMLRLYPGIQQGFAEISEAMVAKMAKISIDLVVQSLSSAQAEEILIYLQAQDKPQLTFVRERVPIENLHIDMEKFRFRQTTALNRMEQSIRYAETRRCRSQQLLAYFGEKESKRCGICDVCTGRNESDVPDAVFETYEKKIAQVLQKEPLPLADVLSAFAMKRHELVTQVLNYLIEEQRVTEDELGKLSYHS